MSKEMKDGWSSEQIASGLRLAESGVPMPEILQMMGASPELFSAWKADYAEVFNHLIITLTGQMQLDNASTATAGWRIAYLSGCVGRGEVESELRACKLPYSVLENPAAVAGELLRSGSMLSNCQKLGARNCFAFASRPLLEDSSQHTMPAEGDELSASSRGQSSEKRKSEEDGAQPDQAGASRLVLVSVQILQLHGNSLKRGATRDAETLSGVFSGEIDELRWRTTLPAGSSIDVPIAEGAGLKYSLEGILDAPIAAIRAFYTSPADALLLGNLLIKKSDSPQGRA